MDAVKMMQQPNLKKELCISALSHLMLLKIKKKNKIGEG